MREKNPDPFSQLLRDLAALAACVDLVQEAGEVRPRLSPAALKMFLPRLFTAAADIAGDGIGPLKPDQVEFLRNVATAITGQIKVGGKAVQS